MAQLLLEGFEITFMCTCTQFYFTDKLITISFQKEAYKLNVLSCITKLSIFGLPYFSGYVSRMNDIELRRDTDRLLFELWMALISAGPGSSHLEMMDIILKNESCTLWMYMQVSLWV